MKNLGNFKIHFFTKLFGFFDDNSYLCQNPFVQQ